MKKIFFLLMIGSLLWTQSAFCEEEKPKETATKEVAALSGLPAQSTGAVQAGEAAGYSVYSSMAISMALTGVAIGVGAIAFVGSTNHSHAH